MLFKKYPKLKAHYAHCNTYTRLNHAGQLIEKWEKDKNGHWIDVTKREFARMEVERLMKELDKLYPKVKIDPQEYKLPARTPSSI